MKFEAATEVTDSAIGATGMSLHASMADTLGGLIDGIAQLDRMEASIAAHKAELVDQARQWSELIESAADDSTRDFDRGWNAAVRARRTVVTELACALRIPERTAESLVVDSQMLLADLPHTFEALSSGAITWRHTRSLVDHARTIPTGAVAAFEETLVPFAAKLTVAQFDRKARVHRERLHPETIEVRQQVAVEDRAVDLQPGRDGMAWLTAYLPAAQAHGAYNRLTDIVRVQQRPEETRTLTQLRADLFAELLLNGTLDCTGDTADDIGGKTRPDTGIRARVLVTVPALTLLGRSDEPAVLEGYGPIDLETALDLAGAAPSFTRILTHPETGAVLSVGRDRYSVPADLRTWLRVRDGTCRFPGCSRGARICEIDHTQDWQHDGHTEHDNLAHLCPAHHRLKHMTGWRVRQLDDGVIEWTSPTGKTYTTEPETQMQAAPNA
jgi:hypothetical protein